MLPATMPLARFCVICDANGSDRRCQVILGISAHVSKHQLVDLNAAFASAIIRRNRAPFMHVVLKHKHGVRQHVRRSRPDGTSRFYAGAKLLKLRWLLATPGISFRLFNT